MSEIAKFRFVGYRITNSSISFKESVEISKETDIEFMQSRGVNQKENKFRLILEVNIKDKNESLLINVICNGYFEFDKDLPEEEMSIFFNTSAPAILFPYLRAYVSTLTALAGIPPVTLPTVNLSGGVLDNEKE